MKVEVEAIQEFNDLIYGKKRVIGDKFVCSKELALKRKDLFVNGISRPLIKILRVVSDDYPEEPKVENEELEKFFNKIFKRTENRSKLRHTSIFLKNIKALESILKGRFFGLISRKTKIDKIM